MKLNNKGFAITSILYGLLILFVLRLHPVVINNTTTTIII